LGINAVILAVRLRKATPNPPRHVLQVMVIWRQFRKRRADKVLNQRAIEPCALLKLPATEWNQLVIPDGMSNQ
jgi:hypothetical protein